MSEPFRLTQFSHGAGCGCKISPKVLDVILADSGSQNLDPGLWVDCAAVVSYFEGRAKDGGRNADRISLRAACAGGGDDVVLSGALGTTERYRCDTVNARALIP